MPPILGTQPDWATHPADCQPMMLSWTNDISVHIPALDNDNREFIQAINDLNIALWANKKGKKVGKILARIAVYTGDHFIQEEEFMRQSGYPARDRHIIKHQKLIDRLSNLVYEFEFGRDTLAQHTSDLFKDWVGDHLKIEDRAFGRYFKRIGGFRGAQAAKADLVFWLSSGVKNYLNQHSEAGNPDEETNFLENFHRAVAVDCSPLWWKATLK